MEQCVSVIVPIYMVEPYLKRAVDSIRNQTYQKLEIILVDDGSMDQCGRICDDYAKADNRIVVIHKENGGLSDARNAGLDVAHGEYIMFVDSDDYIAPDCVETLLKCLTEHDADVSMCSYAVTDSIEYDESIWPKSDGHEYDGSVEICDRRKLLSNLYDANHKDATYFIVSWNKIYKASLWDGIRFPKGKIHEDEATTYKIYDRAQKGIYLHKPLYGYFSAPDSITRAKFNIKRLQWMDALDDRIAYFENKLTESQNRKKNYSELINDNWKESKQATIQEKPEKIIEKDTEDQNIEEQNIEELDFLQDQIACAKRARADAAIHYYYPLKDELPMERDAAKRLKKYVYQEWKNEKRPGYLIFSLSAPLYRLITNIDRDKKERVFQILCVILFAWLTFLCFYKLDVKYVDPWDEARHGVNAYEMLKQGKLIESTYRYETDYYNLKPPLSMWSIMLSMLIFGKSVFSLRFASVLCYLILALVVVCFARKRYGRTAALFSLMLLTANTTPFIAHMVRAGDADSLYVLLFSLAMLCMLQIRENHQKLYWCGFFFALAFLTKSFHAGVIVAIGGLYLLLTGELKRIKVREYLKFFASFAIPLCLWVFGRICVDGTAFLKEMWLTDVMGRSKSGFGSNEAGFSYYFSYYIGNMTKSVPVYRVALVLLLLAAGILLIVKVADAKKQTDAKKKKDVSFFKHLKVFLFHRDVIGMSLWILVPTMAFSLVRTKLLWYQYPSVTALLIVTGIVTGIVCEKKQIPLLFRMGVGVVTIVTACYFSYSLFQTFESYGKDGYMTNDFQLLIQDVAAGQDSGDFYTAVYRALPTDDPNHPIDSKWAQQDVFVAEAYGEYHCDDGGFEGMIFNSASRDLAPVSDILFTTTQLYDFYMSNMEDDVNMQVIGSRGEYVAVELVH
ncbi:MAG: glycosyltransferase [Lachnospiraceae bacterium]